MSLLLIALFGSAKVAVCAFPAIGFCISMMYSIVFSLALNTVAQNHGSFAGILCSGIVGGAGGPLFVSLLSDTTSLRIGMLLILVFMGYITFIGFWAHPLVNNKTVSLKELVEKDIIRLTRLLPIDGMWQFRAICCHNSFRRDIDARSSCNSLSCEWCLR
mgnify:CR=1 FL=1